MAPVRLPGTRPMLLEMLAVIGGMPSSSRVGKVIRVPEPTMVLIVPAPIPARTTRRASSTDTRTPYAGVRVS
jgi:hypothetical protein